MDVLAIELLRSLSPEWLLFLLFVGNVGKGLSQPMASGDILFIRSCSLAIELDQLLNRDRAHKDRLSTDCVFHVSLYLNVGPPVAVLCPWFLGPMQHFLISYLAQAGIFVAGRTDSVDH